MQSYLFAKGNLKLEQIEIPASNAVEVSCQLFLCVLTTKPNWFSVGVLILQLQAPTNKQSLIYCFIIMSRNGLPRVA